MYHAYLHDCMICYVYAVQNHKDNFIYFYTSSIYLHNIIYRHIVGNNIQLMHYVSIRYDIRIKYYVIHVIQNNLTREIVISGYNITYTYDDITLMNLYYPIIILFKVHA